MGRSITNRFFLCAALVALSVSSMEASPIFSNLGVDDYYPESGSWAWGAGGALAHPFTPTGSKYSFDSAGLALMTTDPVSQNYVQIVLANDNMGKPGSAIETILVVGALDVYGPLNPLVTVNSVLHPLLLPGVQYWLITEVLPGYQGLIFWRRGVYPTPTLLALRGTPNGDWSVLTAGSTQDPGGPPGGFRIDGTALPEPSSMLLISLPLAAMLVCGRRFRRTTRG